MSPVQETASAAARRLAAGVFRRGFNLEALHIYTDRTGTSRYWRIRAKHPATGEKWIRPMTRIDAGTQITYVLGEPGLGDFPGGKPLYRLHELDASPEQPVIVTEGELKADRLADLGLLATTSGSADSAAGADWQPLAGRDVIIWPDNDDAGCRYARAVAAKLEVLGCAVRTVDVAVLKLEAKGDAVDWLAAHPAATAKDVLALACQDIGGPSSQPSLAENTKPSGSPTATCQVAASQAPPGSQRATNAPNTCAYAGGEFKLTEQGVLFFGSDNAGGRKSSVWVCSPLGVIAKTRDIHGAEWGRQLEWYDDDGVRHLWAMPLEMLEGDGLDARKELARQGLLTGNTRRAKELLAAYIKVWPVDERALCVDRVGWHGAVYATPHETIGEANERLLFQNAQAVDPAFAVLGTADDWRNAVGALAAGNTRLVFAVSIAFAGPLLDILGKDSGGFHLRGKSSSGKSTALKAAASVWGKPDRYMRTWRATGNGLEGLAAVHNDGCLILDELSQCDPRQAGEIAYMLANGQGKARATSNGAARKSQSWRLVFISSGEESLSAVMSQAGLKPKAGQEVRMADFEADAGVGLGAFETLHGLSDGAALASAVGDAGAKFHGAVGMAWLSRLVSDRSKLADHLPVRLRQFVAQVAPAGATGQVLRVAERFALVGIAGELASQYGLTGWAPGESKRAAKLCFKSWLSGFGGDMNHEDRALLEQVRAFFGKHGASRFDDLDAGCHQRVVNRAGYVRSGPDGGRQFLVLPETFNTELCKGHDPKASTALLIAKGWISPGGDGRPTQKPRLPGNGTVRVYVFTSKAWGSET